VNLGRAREIGRVLRWISYGDKKGSAPYETAKDLQ
jgi:hypothetical protein